MSEKEPPASYNERAAKSTTGTTWPISRGGPPIFWNLLTHFTELPIEESVEVERADLS
jgi:hypothetical protein